MKKIISSLLLCFTILSISSAPLLAIAQDASDGTVDSCAGQIAIGKPCNLPTTKLNSVKGVIFFIDTITKWMFTGLLVLSVLMIIIAAYHYLFSGGDEEGTSKAKKYLIYTVIAIAVAMLSKGVTFIVAEVLM